MKKALENLRNKSEEVRRHLLHIIVLSIGIMLLVIWVFTLNRNINDKDTKEKISNNVEVFSSLKDNLVEGYQGISD